MESKESEEREKSTCGADRAAQIDSPAEMPIPQPLHFLTLIHVASCHRVMQQTASIRNTLRVRLRMRSVMKSIRVFISPWGPRLLSFLIRSVSGQDLLQDEAPSSRVGFLKLGLVNKLRFLGHLWTDLANFLGDL